ncbi:S1 RNA-binding domain-containing protein [Citroniella saccharovorans]|uniref:S1 RNA-binding domain-containing protein n=1 Tax=Citroniella saccharovorans TaxID=2053367 RepID=A0AAW9MTX0_9FIRM|nr:S1 RNA-binding domain-containing protein [Citroniella saccharovorans]MEB3429054.1 S1 RNA-binding domain-containing protein [Citroniella saccharovorans]
MSIEVGDVLEGKVSGITKFGAFIDFEGGASALLHISEISNDYVKNVEDYLSVGDSLKVKVLSTDNGKISVSKRALEIVEKKPKNLPEEFVSKRETEELDMSFEDMMSRFLKDSNEKITDINSRNGKRRAGQKNKNRSYNSNY